MIGWLIRRLPAKWRLGIRNALVRLRLRLSDYMTRLNAEPDCWWMCDSCGRLRPMPAPERLAPRGRHAAWLQAMEFVHADRHGCSGPGAGRCFEDEDAEETARLFARFGGDHDYRPYLADPAEAQAAFAERLAAAKAALPE